MTTRKMARAADLREVLLDRRRELLGDVAERVRNSRVKRSREVGDALDSSDDDVQSGMDFTLLQMKTNLLAGIEQALRRLEAGTYGACAECGQDISAPRLRAIPFAVRCQECEGQREASVSRRPRVADMTFGGDSLGAASFDNHRS